MAATVSFRHHNLNDEHCPNINMNNNFGPIHLVPNPHFTFPAQPTGDGAGTQPLESRRPVSMHSGPTSHRSRGMRQSASALPTFSFNASDTTGLSGDTQQLPPTGLTVPPSPSKSIGHRRGASELVGGDSRLGFNSVLGTSPSKHLDTLPIPEVSTANGSPARRRGHAHRRSAAISSHDLTTILQPRDVNVQTPTGSDPQTPTDRITPTQYFSPPKPAAESSSPVKEERLSAVSSPTGVTDDSCSRPPSRLRVGFSENVEYIPRPLSTVSSETASSVSTARRHSMGNSISSMISLGGIGNPSPRRSPIPATNLAYGFSPRSRPSTESSKAVEFDEQAFRPRSQRPVSESFLPSSSTANAPDACNDVPQPSKKKNFLKLDRRRSEPLISLTASTQMGLSTISLQEPLNADKTSETSEGSNDDLNRKSSRKRVKQWATSILGRKIKEAKKLRSTASFGEVSPVEFSPLEAQPAENNEVREEEPDLDALFSQDPFTDDAGSSSVVSPRVGMTDATFPLFSLPARQADDTSPVIDLDAALGPYGTPAMSWDRPNTSSASKRQLHSSRLTKDFVGPGMHYHRRTESAPALVPFEFGRSSSPGQSPMADVFEEEEDEAAASDSTEEPSICDDAEEEELGTGIQIVDAANESHDQTFDWSFEDGLGIERNNVGRVAHSFNMAVPHLSAPPVGVRRTSVVDDTIVEESSPLEIVQDYEEPRTSSLTKSSDSSDTRTVSAHQSALDLPMSHAQNIPLTPTSYATSTFSSPDFSRHQESFDVTRLGTSASSITDNRTMSSFAMGEPGPEVYMSSDDVPSLTSSRSTMISTMYQGSSRREFSERPGTVACSNSHAEMQASERRRKRSSIQSLSKLMGGPFGESKSRLGSEQRPQTAIAPTTHDESSKRKKENRLSKLMFWRSKSDSRSTFQTK